MAEKDNRSRPERQDWNPHVLVRVLHRIWRIGFSVAKVALGALATVLLIGVICGFVFATMLGDHLQEDIMPKAEINLADYDLEKTSYVYYFDKDGNVQILQQLDTTMDRRWAPYEEIPQDLIHAAVAIEDQRFYLHQGVDWITTAKACINMFFGGSSQFGGSTLTQQLIKNLELMYDDTADDVTVQRKLMEIFRAQAFEKVYDKEVVLEWYMNTVYFGEGCYGVKSAADIYFGKELQDLTTGEMAALIGITNNPSMYNPFSKKEYEFKGAVRDGAGRNQYRQQVVLTQMFEQGWLTKDEYLEAYRAKLVYKSGIAEQDRWTYCKDVFGADKELISKGCGYNGPVRDLVVREGEENTYYCPDCGQKITITTDASKNVYSWYVDTVIEDVAKAMAASEGEQWHDSMRGYYVSRICRGGYHIYTPYDPEVQQAVDNIYTDLEQIPEVRSGQQLQSGIVIVDNRTGDIVALAGGVGEKLVADATNRAVDVAKQIGSSIKPLTVYAPAFEAGLINPATLMDDLPLTYNNDNPYPLNDNRQYNYQRTIWRGIVSSVNAVACNTLDNLGLRYSYNFAKHQFGLSTLEEKYVSPWSGEVLSDVGIAPLGLGALSRGATVRDVTNAYATFANNGIYREARTFTLVLDSDGGVVLENKQESKQLLSQKTVDYMNYCLNSAVNEGTGTAARMYYELGIDVAGKTGTTGDNKDRYFAGFTGHYTAAVWTGFDYPEVISLVGDTSNPSCRLWKKVMLQIHEGKENIPLYNASNMESVTVCMESGLLATDACKNDIRTDDLSRTWQVLVYPEDAPTKFCDQHVTVDYCTQGHGVANEYCHKFANVGAALLQDKALVKMTPSRMAQILAAEGKGMTEHYLRDDYIYLVDAYGNPLSFHGFHENINVGLDIPYKGCMLHTAESWEKYKQEHPWISDGTQPKPDPEPLPEQTPETEPTPETQPETTVPEFNENLQTQEPTI